MKICAIEPIQRSTAWIGRARLAQHGRHQVGDMGARLVEQPGLRLAQQHQHDRQRDHDDQRKLGIAFAGDLPGVGHRRGPLPR